MLPDPDGPGRRAVLERAIEDESAALGPTVAPADAHALAALGPAHARAGGARGAARAPGLVRTSEQLSTVILLQDRRDGAGAGARPPAPRSTGWRPGERERLLETLAAWLAHQRHTPRIAEELHVHPQTVRYRIAKLRELLGDALDDAGRPLRARARAASRAPRWSRSPAGYCARRSAWGT